MTRTELAWNWTGVAPLIFDGQDVRLRRLVSEEFPETKLSHSEIVTYLVDLGARFERWLHQDEFGPTRQQQAAAVHELMKAAQTLQKQFAKGPPSLKSSFDTMLRHCNDPSNTVLEALFEAAVDLEHCLSSSKAPRFHLGWASRLRECVNSLIALSHVTDTSADVDICLVAAKRRFDLAQATGPDFSFADAECWIAGYWTVLFNTLQALNETRGADERVSLKLLVELLCEFWERETKRPVTAHGIVKDVYVSRPVTAAGQFVVAAVEAMLPDASWSATHVAQSVRAITFLPDCEQDRERQVVGIMRDFVRRRECSKNRRSIPSM
jgi:hypothetical protein